MSLTFSLKYLVNFCKASALSSRVKICLSNEVPLLVEYEISGNSWLRFYLAPKVRSTCGSPDNWLPEHDADLCCTDRRRRVDVRDESPSVDEKRRRSKPSPGCISSNKQLGLLLGFGCELEGCGKGVVGNHLRVAEYCGTTYTHRALATGDCILFARERLSICTVMNTQHLNLIPRQDRPGCLYLSPGPWLIMTTISSCHAATWGRCNCGVRDGGRRRLV